MGVVNTYTHDSFGNLTGSAGSVANPFQYTGRDYVSETGLRYYRARYYDSSMGRFLSEDPAGFSAGPDFYAYVGGDPINSVEKQCEQKGEDCAKLIGAIYQAIGLIKLRYYDLMMDPLDLSNTAFTVPNPAMPNAGTWQGHIEALASWKQRLNNLIKEAKKKGCRIPPEAHAAAEIPYPNYPGWKTPPGGKGITP